MDTPDYHRRDFLRDVCVGAAAVALPGGVPPPDPQGGERPNVILIMTDDQGYGDLGATGNPLIRTPNIDMMAAGSARMENFYVHPVCSPTRACLMTGRYNYRTRVVDTWVGRSMMEPDEVTVAEILRDTGYDTGIFGKWHLGDCYPMRPMDQGFGESLVHRGGGIGQPADPPGGEGKYTDPILFHNGRQFQANGYCTDVYFNSAMEWIENAARRRRNFFAYITPNAPHAPFHDVPKDLYIQYRAMDLGNDRFPQTRGHALPAEADNDRRARIFSMITNIDENVGRLFDRLDVLDLTRNTIVIFMVDNGPNGQRYVAGMRGSKSSVYEGGIRSPFFMHWPDRLQPGSSSDRIAAHIDVLPTLLDACGVSVPDGLDLDGRSVLPLLTGEVADWPDRTLFIQSHRGDRPALYHNFAARKQKWKLLHASGFGRERFEGLPQFELFDMEFDPLEQHNIANRRPDIVRYMLEEYDAWFKDVGNTRPDNYAPPRIHIGSRHEDLTVLTRQDWRHIEGRGWGADSNGYWELFADRPGTYSVRMRFPAMESDGEATLKIDDQVLTLSLTEGVIECTFEDVYLLDGPLRLQAELVEGSRTRGPHQVDVSRQ